jgi:hypothetical protein
MYACLLRRVVCVGYQRFSLILGSVWWQFLSDVSMKKLPGFLLFCLPCIIVYQYSETNAIHDLFSLLRIKDLYMLRALLAYPQEALNKRQLVYCALKLVGF